MSRDGSDLPPRHDHSDFPLMILIPSKQVQEFENGQTREKLHEVGRVRLGDTPTGGKVLYLLCDSQKDLTKGIDLVMQGLESTGEIREVTVFVPEDMVSLLIGTHGRHIDIFQEFTRTSVCFEKKQIGLTERKVKISGFSQDIRFAIEKLHSRVRDKNPPETPAFVKFVIPDKSAAHLIGKNCYFVKFLLHKYGAELKIKPNNNCEENKEQLAVLFGRKSDCLEALPEVVTKTEDAIWSVGSQNYTDKTIILVKTRKLEGAFNDFVREVKREVDVSFRVFKCLNDEFRVEITGELRHRLKAMRLLLEDAGKKSPRPRSRSRSRSRSPVPLIINIIVPKVLVGRLIGKGGDNVKMLKSRCGCHINFKKNDLKTVQTGDGQEGRACTVKGSPAAIAMGVRYLWEQILKFER